MPDDNEGRSLATARLERFATILLICVTVIVGGLTIWDRVMTAQPAEAVRQEPPVSPKLPLPTESVSIENAPIRGNRSAKVALIVFSDFECPYCASSALKVLPEIERQYLRAGTVLLAWRHLPLPIHANARRAAEAAECAGVQGRFWEFHDWAFQNQKRLDEPNLHGAARTIGLDAALFGACLDGQAAARVDADLDAAEALSVTATPTWFIGVIESDGRVKVMDRLDGSRAFFVFQSAIDRTIAAADADD